jgi:hypothetical protein
MKNRTQQINNLRNLVVNYNGPIAESPHYAELALLVVSDFLVESATPKTKENAHNQQEKDT